MQMHWTYWHATALDGLPQDSRQARRGDNQPRHITPRTHEILRQPTLMHVLRVPGNHFDSQAETLRLMCELKGGNVGAVGKKPCVDRL